MYFSLCKYARQEKNRFLGKETPEARFDPSVSTLICENNNFLTHNPLHPPPTISLCLWGRNMCKTSNIQPSVPCTRRWCLQHIKPRVDPPGRRRENNRPLGHYWRLQVWVGDRSSKEKKKAMPRRYPRIRRGTFLEAIKTKVVFD